MENQCQRWSLEGNQCRSWSLQGGKCSIKMSTLRPWARWSKKFIVLTFLTLLHDTWGYLLQIWKLYLPQTYQTDYSYEALRPHLRRQKAWNFSIWFRPKAKIDRTPYPLEQLKAGINFNECVGKCTHGQDWSFYFRARAGSFMKSIILNNVNIRNEAHTCRPGPNDQAV